MDLTTKYLGLKLRNPIVASASPLSHSLDKIKRLEDAGAAAVVLFSLFEEQVRQEEAALDHFLSFGTDSFAEALSYFPAVDEFQTGPDEYLELLAKAAKGSSIPIIGSLNGISDKGWTEYAYKMQEAGAKAIELNIYLIPTELDRSGAEVEQLYVDTLAKVKSHVRIPVAVKLSPYFSAMGNMAQRLVAGGADGLVLFNRFYQPDFNIDDLEVERTLDLSSANEIRLPLLWLSILSGRLKTSLAASTGVQNAPEVIKYLLAGADAVMTTSALLRHGPQHVSIMLKELEAWLTAKDYKSVKQLKGSMNQRSVADPTAFERANYIKILEKYRK